MSGLPAYSPGLAAELRAAAGLSQAAMAQAVGYTAAQNWSAVERGERAPSWPVWLLALIVAGRHPDFVRRTSEPVRDPRHRRHDAGWVQAVAGHECLEQVAGVHAPNMQQRISRQGLA